MRDFVRDLRAAALTPATLGGNVEGAGAGWPPERILDACAARGLGGVVFWRREIGTRAAAIGARARAAGVAVADLCRAPFLVGPLAAPDRGAVMDEVRAAIDRAAELGAPVLTIVAGGVEPGTRGVAESLARLADRVAEAAPHAADYGVDVTPRLEVVKVAEPAARKGGVKLGSVDELVAKLKSDGVI